MSERPWMGSGTRGVYLLARFATITTAQARIVAEAFGPAGPDDSAQPRYIDRTVAYDGMPGQLRVPISLPELSTPLFDWLTPR